jgi:hypothetical protein
MLTAQYEYVHYLVGLHTAILEFFYLNTEYKLFIQHLKQK